MNTIVEQQNRHEYTVSNFDIQVTDEYIQTLNDKILTADNQFVFDNVLLDVKNNISQLSQLPLSQKNIIANSLLVLWKNDRANQQVHRENAIYENLIYTLLGGSEINNQLLETAKQSYEEISGLATDLQNLYMNFLDQWKQSSVSTNQNLQDWAKGNVVSIFSSQAENLKNKYPNYAQGFIGMFQNNLQLPSLEKPMEHLFNLVNNEVVTVFQKYENQKNVTHEEFLKKNIDNTIITQIATLKGIKTQTETTKIDYKQMREQTNLSLLAMKQSVQQLPFGRNAVLGALNQIEQKIQKSSDVELPSLIKDELQRAKSLCEKYGSLVGDLKGKVDEAILNFNKTNVLSSSKEQSSGNTWQNILESGDKQPSSFKRFVEEEQYRQSYNDVFDIMYLALKNNSLTPGEEVNFRGQPIKITPQYINNFKLLIRSQLPNGAEPDFNAFDIVYAHKNAQGKLPHYVEGTRVVVLKYTTSSSKEQKTGYVIFGNEVQSKKDLSQGLETVLQTKKIEELFTPVSKENPGDYVDAVGKLQLDGHGGSEGLDYLFQKKPTEILSYLKEKEGGNLKNFLDKISHSTKTIVNKEGKEENISLYSDEEKNDYIKVLIKGISGDKELLSTYMNLKSDSKFLGTDFMTKQIITEKLFSLTTGKPPFINKESDSELFMSIITSKATIDAQKEGANKPKTIEDQIRSVVGMLFQHPIGKMLMKFLDSLFDGKGGLLKKFGTIPGFSDVLNKEFVKQYGFDADQKKVLDSFDTLKVADNSPSILNGDLKDNKFLDTLNTIAKTFTDKNTTTNTQSVINQFYNGDTLNSKVLDVNLLSSYFLANKTNEGLKNISYESLFVVDSSTQKIAINENMNKKEFDQLLSTIIQDEGTHKTIITADMKLKKDKKLFDKDLFGITNQVDYAKAISAYLMGGSKGNGNFHYVLSENNISGAKPIEKTIETTKPVENQELIQSRDTLKIAFSNKIINGKYDGYDFSNYNYDASEASSQKQYQSNVLEPLKKIFDLQKKPGVEKTNFELLSSTFDGSIFPTDKTQENMIHFKNMFIYMNQGKTGSEQLISQDIIQKMNGMSQINVEKDKLIFSSQSGDKIELSSVSGKLETKYISKKS